MTVAAPDEADPRTTPDRPIRNHRRFALGEVTLDGAVVGGATVDDWNDATGRHCWSARVVMRGPGVPPDGVLAGRARDGRVVRGRVALIGPGPAVRGRGTFLVEWGGVGPLQVDDAVDDA